MMSLFLDKKLIKEYKTDVYSVLRTSELVGAIAFSSARALKADCNRLLISETIVIHVYIFDRGLSRSVAWCFSASLEVAGSIIGAFVSPQIDSAYIN